MFKYILGLLALVMYLSGCGSTSGGKAILKFAKATAARQVTGEKDLAVRGEAPTLFKMKLIAAYITEDITTGLQNNVGKTPFIYLNPDCNDNISKCDIAEGHNNDGEAFTYFVTSFFDFSTAETANTSLNSQARSIETGTYKYARLEFCKAPEGSDPNIEWQATGMASTSKFRQNNCTANSAAFDPPLVVATGETVTITLTYDLSNAVSTGSGTANCDTVSGKCFQLPNFVPSATKG